MQARLVLLRPIVAGVRCRHSWRSACSWRWRRRRCMPRRRHQEAEAARRGPRPARHYLRTVPVLAAGGVPLVRPRLLKSSLDRADHAALVSSGHLASRLARRHSVRAAVLVAGRGLPLRVSLLRLGAAQLPERGVLRPARSSAGEGIRPLHRAVGGRPGAFVACCGPRL